jgi:glucuronoarabinoxylan endo-1,4-beta-xylanase
MLRIRYGDGLGVAKAAAKYGVTVWMTPWGTGSGGSPGGPDTTTETNPNGCKGSFPVLSNGQDLANNLVSWVQNAKAQGVPIYAVSAENEPDSCGINQTTVYSATQLATWIGSYLGPAMSNIGVKVMAPETQNGCGFPGYFSAIQSNSAAWSAVDIFASHEYGCGALPTEPSIASAGKEYWETEVDTGSVSGDTDGMPSAINLAQTIHTDLTKSNLNAWHYWWLWAGGTSGLYDTTTKVWRKALWVMGNFSRFVRPGYVRVSTSGNPPSGVAVTAYINPSNNALVVVAINKNSASTNLPLYISGSAPCALIPWETSASNNLVPGSSVSVSNSRVSLPLAGQSVTTFVGMP